MKTISPFAGDPKTKVFLDDQKKRAFAVKARALSPEAARKIGSVAILSALVLGVSTGYYMVSHYPQSNAGAVVMLLGWIPACGVMDLFYRAVFSASRRIVLTEDKVIVGRFPFRKAYDRRLPHSFALHPHDKGEWEQRTLEYEAQKAAQKGLIARKTPYYSRSFHLSFEYLGQRNDLMSIFKPEVASRILARLIACDEALNAQCGIGDGFPTSPEDEWNDEPGGL